MVPILLLLLVAMLLTESWSGILAFGATLCVVALISRSRVYAWAIGALILGAIASRPDLFANFAQRIAASYNPVAGVVWLFLFFGLITRRGLWLVRQGIEPYRTIASEVPWGSWRGRLRESCWTCWQLNFRDMLLVLRGSYRAQLLIGEGKGTE